MSGIIQVKILSQMVEQFRQKHQRAPQTIVISPLALVALGIKRSVAPTWNGIPVDCREFDETHVAKTPGEARALGVALDVPTEESVEKVWSLVSCDLHE